MSKYDLISNAVTISGFVPGRTNPRAIPKPVINTIILTIKIPLKNLANKYSAFVKG